MQSDMAIKSAVKQLVDYDPYYGMSDDPRWYEAGLNAENKLKAELKEHQLHEVLSYLESLKMEAIRLYNQIQQP